MNVSTRRRTTAEDVRRVALAALATALDDGKQEVKAKPGLTGMRAVATGAVLYTAGRAAFAGRRFVRDHMGDDDVDARGDEDYEEYDDDEPEARAEDEEDDEYDEEDEPEARADEE